MTIKPCPFCGGSKLEIAIGTTDREGCPVSVVCDDCGAQGPWNYTRKIDVTVEEVAADTKWNERTS